jgi:hypothetical protein
MTGGENASRGSRLTRIIRIGFRQGWLDSPARNEPGN